jgi:hypothetical protein
MWTRNWWLRPVWGCQAHARFCWAAANHLPVGLRGLSARIDLLARAVRPIARQRQINPALICVHLPLQAGDIGFLRATLFKFLAQKALCRFGPRKDDDAAGIAIQPMHQQRIPAGSLQAGDQAILPTLELAGHRQQTSRLVQHNDRRVLMQNLQRRLRGIIGKIRDERGFRQCCALRQQGGL